MNQWKQTVIKLSLLTSLSVTATHAMANQIPYQSIGVTYNALHASTKPSVDSVNQDLDDIKGYKMPDGGSFNSIRSYYAAYNGGGVVLVNQLDHIKGLSVLLGLYIDDQYVNKSWVESDYKKFVDPYLKKNNNQTVIGVLIGNEDYDSVTKATIIKYLQQVKTDHPLVPVGTAQTTAFWLTNLAALEIAKDSDFIGVNIYPQWDWNNPDKYNQPQLNGQSLTPADAFTSFKQQYEKVAAKYPGKQIVVTETGWPTTYGWVVNVPVEPKQCQQGLDNANAYFELISAWAKQNKVVVYYYSMFDDWYGVNTTSQYNMHFGLLDNNGNLKVGVSC
ncbi:glycoside hydrolase family 17 protein [Cysteiniphilum halobium]|uniref:hypothetical protein n=1 Tax=Cysteiniphilum halobium TaxID=2219059 RepID=UPI000E646673|nr:hypothetical protein [Cysteiniphilum halobium]